MLPVVADGRFGLEGLSRERLIGTFFPRANGRFASCSPHTLLLTRCAFSYLLLLAMEFTLQLEDFFFKTTLFEVDLHYHCPCASSAAAHFKLLRHHPIQTTA